jgi:hypothetical protein
MRGLNICAANYRRQAMTSLTNLRNNFHPKTNCVFRAIVTGDFAEA